MNIGIPEALRDILEDIPVGSIVAVSSCGDLIYVNTGRMSFTLRDGEWIGDNIRESSNMTPMITDDFGGASLVLDAVRYGGSFDPRSDDTTDNGESAYDPDMPDKTLAEYMASWDELIREVRESD